MTDAEFAKACRRAFAEAFMLCAESDEPRAQALAAMMKDELRRRGLDTDWVMRTLNETEPDRA